MSPSAVLCPRVQFYVSTEWSFMSPSAVLCLRRVKFYVSAKGSFMSPSEVLCLRRVQFYVSAECSFMSPPSEVLCPSWLCLFPPSAELIKSGSKAEKDKVKRAFFTFRVSIFVAVFSFWRFGSCVTVSYTYIYVHIIHICIYILFVLFYWIWRAQQRET